MNRPILACGSAMLLGLAACAPKSADTGATVQISYAPRSVLRHHCVASAKCGDVNISYVVLNGGDSAVTASIQKVLDARLIALISGDSSLPFQTAIDSVADHFITEFIRYPHDSPGDPEEQNITVKSDVLLANSKVLTVRFDLDSYTGGAHPNTSSSVVSFDLANGGKLLTVTDLVKDTSAVRPMLETGYLASKGMKPGEDISSLLLSGNGKLAWPANVAVRPEGILFAYIDYEVAPHVVGPADVLLTWEQLGTNAQRSRWIPEP